MSVNHPEGHSNVLPFKRVTKRTSAALAASSELRDLLIIYDALIALLRETYDEGLDLLADGLVGTVVRCREELADGIDDETGPRLVKEMRAGLHEIPRVLRSLLPGLGPRLGESMERKLGIQFAKY